MRKETRQKMYCWKDLPHGQIECFTVIIASGEYDTVKAQYESRGYHTTALTTRGVYDR